MLKIWFQFMIIFIFKKTGITIIHFLCSQKKASLLGVVKGAAKEAVGPEVVVHVKAKSDDGGALMDGIFRAVNAQSGLYGDAPVVGHLAKEAPEGNLLEKWAEKLQNERFMVADISNGFSDLFAVKDIAEITNVKKAAYLTSAVMKLFVVPKLEQVIDEEKKVSHSSLMDDTEKVITEPAKIKVKLKAENVDICYPPIFQSGGEFDLRPSATSNDHNLFYESTSVILCAIGSRYSSYCSNVARTFLIDANPLQSKAYGVLLKAQEAVINALKPGRTAAGAYQAAVSIVEKEAPELAANLTRTAGTRIGLEFRESGLNLNGKSDRILKAGMVFNGSLGFQNLQTGTEHPKTQKVSVMLADTVVIGENGPEVLPPSRGLVIQIDQKNEAILLPSEIPVFLKMYIIKTETKSSTFLMPP